MVVLVDQNDQPVGRAPKMEAHREGLLHRAFSVFIFNREGKLLIQRRAMGKYHSPGRWANTCCSHPGPDEAVAVSAVRRLQHEMGFAAELEFRESFVYREDVGGGLTEHELDHVFTGRSDVLPLPHPDEVMAYRYAELSEIREDLERHPEQYCVWFRIIFTRFYEQLKQWAL